MNLQRWGILATMSMTLSEELQWRGFINQTTYEDLTELDSTKWTFYHGFDASADSQTVGNLAAMMLDKAFMRHGHKAIILAGGATSLIGDPGGKDSERPLQNEQTVANNIEKAENQLRQIFAGHDFMLVNNLDWTKDLKLIDFLRDIGKHFSMTPLVQRDYIAKRMGEGGSGISYTEFSYTLLQGYDFLHLHQENGVNLQLAGSDQWGNGLSGVELIRKVTGDEVHVLTLPLIINKATGKKFGKSEDGAVWLDPEKTSVYKFYQFWLNVDDESVQDYLKIFTELDKEKTEEILIQFNSDRSSRLAQKTLAYEVTKLVHGDERATAARKSTEVLFGNAIMTDTEAAMLKQELPVVKFLPEGLAATITASGLATSNTEANRFFESGAIYINGERATSLTVLKPGDNLVRRGKNNFVIIEQE
jgi:tyrosyl-tRNA synthetase